MLTDISVGDWVELVDDATESRVDDPPGVLRQVVAVDPFARRVTLSAGPQLATDPTRHPLLR